MIAPPAADGGGHHRVTLHSCTQWPGRPGGRTVLEKRCGHSKSAKAGRAGDLQPASPVPATRGSGLLRRPASQREGGETPAHSDLPRGPEEQSQAAAPVRLHYLWTCSTGHFSRVYTPQPHPVLSAAITTKASLLAARNVAGETGKVTAITKKQRTKQPVGTSGSAGKSERCNGIRRQV